MAKETRYFKKKLSATSTEQSYTFPEVAKFSILNAGGDDITFEVDNALDADSFVLPAGMSVEITMSPISLAYKAITTTATLYLTGVKSIKS